MKRRKLYYFNVVCFSLLGWAKFKYEDCPLMTPDQRVVPTPSRAYKDRETSIFKSFAVTLNVSGIIH